jgi:hypothetical protein
MLMAASKKAALGMRAASTTYQISAYSIKILKFIKP